MKAPASIPNTRDRRWRLGSLSAGFLMVTLGCGTRSELEAGNLTGAADGTGTSAGDTNSGGAATAGGRDDGAAGRANDAGTTQGGGPWDGGEPGTAGERAIGGNTTSGGDTTNIGGAMIGGSTNGGVGGIGAAGRSDAAGDGNRGGVGNTGGDGNRGGTGTGGSDSDAGGDTDQPTDVTDDVVGLWRFNEGEGSMVYDESGWDNHGTQTGGEWGPGELLTPALVDVPDHESLWLTESLTLEALVRVDSYSQTHGMIIFRGDGRAGLDPYVLSTEDGDTIECMISDSEGGTAVLSAAGVRSKMCVICTLDAGSGEMRLYIDGALTAETTTTVRSAGPLVPQASSGVSFGAHARRSSSSYPLYGALDEIRILRRALAAEEVAERCDQLLPE